MKKIRIVYLLVFLGVLFYFSFLTWQAQAPSDPDLFFAPPEREPHPYAPYIIALAIFSVLIAIFSDKTPFDKFYSKKKSKKN